MGNITRINTSFTNYLNSNSAKKEPRPYNRYKGGHKSFSGPFVSGYWYLLLELPIGLLNGKMTESLSLFSTDINTHLKIKKYLHGVAEAFTPPSKTIQKGEVSGFGGIKKFIPLNSSITPNFSITFFELSGMPIHKIFKIWTNMFNSQYGNSSSIVNKARAYIFLCKPTWSHTFGIGSDLIRELAPDEEDVEEMYYFEGVFPETDCSDSLNSDISQNSMVQYQIQFSFDSYYFGLEHDDIMREGLDSLRKTVGAYEHKIGDIIP